MHIICKRFFGAVFALLTVLSQPSLAHAWEDHVPLDRFTTQWHKDRPVVRWSTATPQTTDWSHPPMAVNNGPHVGSIPPDVFYHVSGGFALGSITNAAFRYADVNGGTRYAWTAVSGFLVGGIEEMRQTRVPHRSASMGDVLTTGLGSMVTAGVDWLSSDVLPDNYRISVTTGMSGWYETAPANPEEFGLTISQSTFSIGLDIRF